MALGAAPGRNFSACRRARVKMLNRALFEAGIFVMRDDPQGRRYGHRDEKTGRIIKAFGFDLSLLAQRHDEFEKIAAAAKIERNRMRKLRPPRHARPPRHSPGRRGTRRCRGMTARRCASCCAKRPSWSRPAAHAAARTSWRLP